MSEKGEREREGGGGGERGGAVKREEGGGERGRGGGGSGEGRGLPFGETKGPSLKMLLARAKRTTGWAGLLAPR